MSYINYYDAKINQWVWEGVNDVANDSPELAKALLIPIAIGTVFECILFYPAQFIEELITIELTEKKVC